MEKKQNISVPQVGMNRKTSASLLGQNEYIFQKNGNSYSESGSDAFNLTDEHSNILASQFKSGFRVIGLVAHEVRNKTYFMLHNPTTKVSEIGCIKNNRNFTYEEDNGQIQANPLEQTTQVDHQVYETLLEDSCNLCLNFDLEHPIFDLIIKEQNIGTSMFWTETPGKNVLRYIRLDDLEEYRTTGSDRCGDIPEDTCLDCDKLRVFRLHVQLNIKDYKKVLGGSLKKGAYEVFGAYCDEFGNEFTSYFSLTPVIPIFDEANVIHEQVDNNAKTNSSIKIDLDRIDSRFDRYKIVARYYTSQEVFVNYEVGIFNTSNEVVIISDNDGASVPTTRLSLQKLTVESVDGITAAGNMLFLNGIKDKEPINLQPIASLLGASLRWKSYRAKEDLYNNADSYMFLSYNRGENQAFGFSVVLDDGTETSIFPLIPQPLSANHPLNRTLDANETSADILSITSLIGNCDGNIRDKYFQYKNTAELEGVCTVSSGVPVVKTTEDLVAYVNVDIPNIVPSTLPGTITITLEENESFIDIRTYIQDNIGNLAALQPQPGSSDIDITPFIDVENTTISAINNPAGTNLHDSVADANTPEILDPYNSATDTGCNEYTTVSEPQEIIVGDVINEEITFEYKEEFSEYTSINTPINTLIFESNGGSSKINEDFSFKYNCIAHTVNEGGAIGLSR